jgi:hypothetical protein
MAKAQASPAAPTVGRIVHFGEQLIAHGPESVDIVVPRAAWILEVLDGNRVTIEVHPPNGGHHIQKANYSEELAVGAWSWPPRD